MRSRSMRVFFEKLVEMLLPAAGLVHGCGPCLGGAQASADVDSLPGFVDAGNWPSFCEGACSGADAGAPAACSVRASSSSAASVLCEYADAGAVQPMPVSGDWMSFCVGHCSSAGEGAWDQCEVARGDAGALGVTCSYPGCGGAGRRPEGYRPSRRSRGASAAGRYFAELAELEAASVPAFERLAAELSHHDAPARLVRGALRARRDEIRHARIAGALARRHDGALDAATPRVPRRVRALEAVARENAIEGCVRETFAALVATWQSRAARDERVRRAFAAIAADETRHAALAWEIDAWAGRRLGKAACRRVADARARAAGEVWEVAMTAIPGALVREAGLPPPGASRALAGALMRSLWAEGALGSTARARLPLEPAFPLPA